jgi:hypothetical protein
VNHKRKTPHGRAAATASARALIRGGIDEKTGEVVTAGALAGRVGWCAALVSGMAGGTLASHWNARDVAALAGGVDAAGRPLPARQGWKWAICPSPHCGWQGDRDQGAWQRIAACGLTHQRTTITDRSSRTMMVAAIKPGLEAGAVVTPKPARPRPKADSARRTSARPAPRRRGAPSPARPPGRTGQRPEGHVPTVRLLPRAAHRNQDVTTISTPARRHQPRGAALGAGFHLHAHATPPRWEPEPGQPLRLTQDP